MRSRSHNGRLLIDEISRSLKRTMNHGAVSSCIEPEYNLPDKVSIRRAVVSGLTDSVSVNRFEKDLKFCCRPKDSLRSHS